MSDESSNLKLPYILAAQAQKHVTHNEAIRLLDAMVQLSVIDANLTAPPGSPAAGDRHIVAATATGDWTGWEGSVAYFADGAWYQLEPGIGWQAFNEATSLVLIWTGAAWTDISAAKQNVSEKGQANGYAPLNSSGKIAKKYVPFADDVKHFDTFPDFPGTGSGGVLYIDDSTGNTYTWNGSTYVPSTAVAGTTDTIPEGVLNLYFTAARVLATILAGLSLVTSTAVTAADSVLVAIGKLQAQVTLRAPLASPPLTGTPTAPTASPGTNSTQIATTAYADAAAAAIIGALDVVVFKGVTNCSANPNYPAADAGHWYVVSVAGKIGGASGVTVEAGDAFLCLVDSSASGNQATVGANWAVMNKNLDHVVIGPAGAVTDGAISLFDGTTGLLLKQISDAAFKTRLALTGADVGKAGMPFRQTLALSDLTTALVVGTNKGYFRATDAFSLTEIRLAVLTAPTGATIIVNCKKNGTTIFSTKVSIDATELTSQTAATPMVLTTSPTAVAADDVISFDIDQIGSTIAGAGLQATVIGVYA